MNAVPYLGELGDDLACAGPGGEAFSLQPLGVRLQPRLHVIAEDAGMAVDHLHHLHRFHEGAGRPPANQVDERILAARKRRCRLPRKYHNAWRTQTRSREPQGQLSLSRHQPSTLGFRRDKSRRPRRKSQTTTKGVSNWRQAIHGGVRGTCTQLKRT